MPTTSPPWAARSSSTRHPASSGSTDGAGRRGIRTGPIATLGHGARRLADRLRAPAFVGWCLGWLVVVWAMLSPAPPAMPGMADKLVHFAGFLGVSVASITFCRTARQLLLAVGFCAVAGVLLELAQGLTTVRLFEWGDMVANLLGTGAGGVLAALLLLLFRSGRRVPA